MPSSILLANYFFRDHYSAKYYGQIMANHSKLPYCIALLKIPHAKKSTLFNDHGVFCYCAWKNSQTTTWDILVNH